MNKNIELKLKLLTDSPGCYLMKHKNEIIYVGKAKNLKNRVSSYFHSLNNQSIKVKAMVSKIDDFDIILCSSNYEALNLECNLIKEYRPFYNILLKDDKQYPYIKINIKEKYPRLLLARKKENDKCLYFGPYLSTNVIKQASIELSKIFPLRNCKLVFPLKEKKRPCMRYEIGRCLAPCAGLCTEEEYNDVLTQNINFLKGNIKEVEEKLEIQMLKHSSNLEFEKAALVRDRIKALKQIGDKQIAVLKNSVVWDAWAISANAKDALIYRLNILDGKIIRGDSFFLEGLGKEEKSNILSSFLTQAYDEESNIPNEILVENEIEEKDDLVKWLSEKAGKKVRLTTPIRGEKRAIVDICLKNSLDALLKKELYNRLQESRTIGAVESLAKNIGLNYVPKRIEGYDISNTQGTYSVASMVVFIDGKPAKKEYRKFKIKTVEGANDFASMNEVLLRRLEHAKEEMKELSSKGIDIKEGKFSNLPDLILVDGGPIQLEFAKKAIDKYKFKIDVFGLAKRDEEVFLPDRKSSIIIDSHDPALHLIQRIRDEAHRFAISFHRNIRDKSMIKSELLNIKGIGEKSFKKLMIYFKNLDAIKKASVDELLKAKINRNIANNIFNYYNSNNKKE